MVYNYSTKDKQELQEKFAEKSRQKRKLDEMYDQLRSEYESVKRSAIQPANNFYSRAEPDLFSNTASMMDNRDSLRKGSREDIWPTARHNNSNSGHFEFSSGSPAKEPGLQMEAGNKRIGVRSAFGVGPGNTVVNGGAVVSGAMEVDSRQVAEAEQAGRGGPVEEQCLSRLALARGSAAGRNVGEDTTHTKEEAFNPRTNGEGIFYKCTPAECDLDALKASSGRAASISSRRLKISKSMPVQRIHEQNPTLLPALGCLINTITGQRLLLTAFTPCHFFGLRRIFHYLPFKKFFDFLVRLNDKNLEITSAVHSHLQTRTRPAKNPVRTNLTLQRCKLKVEGLRKTHITRVRRLIHTAAAEGTSGVMPADTVNYLMYRQTLVD
nr:E3 ubiquitin-protein ligase CCNB1IP1 homolog isoform X3 [Ipomoea batatas]